MMMSVQNWLNAERFYNGHFATALMGIGFIVLVVMIFGLYGAKKGKLRKLALGLLTLDLLFSGVVGCYYYRYLPYLRLAPYVTPQMRSHEYKLGALRPYDPALMGIYRLSPNTKNLEHLPFYTSKEAKMAIDVLGYHEGYYYMRYEGKVCRLPEYQVTVVTNDQPAEVEGKRFTLNRKDYQQLYFFSPEQAFVKKVLIPKRYKEISPDVDLKSKPYRFEFLTKDHWVFDGFPYTAASERL